MSKINFLDKQSKDQLCPNNVILEHIWEVLMTGKPTMVQLNLLKNDQRRITKPRN